MKNRAFLVFVLVAATASGLAPSPSAASEKEDWDFANGLYMRGIYELAAGEYQRFLEQYPESPSAVDAYFRLAESLWHLGRWQDAVAYYQKLKREDVASPRDQVIRLREALCYKNSGSAEKAGALLREFEKAFPSSGLLPTVYYQLGQIETASGNDGDAVAFFTKAAEAGGESARPALYRKGHLLLRMKKLDEALQTFLKLRESGGRDAMDADALFKIGEIFFQLEKYRQSYEYYAVFLKEYPSSDIAIEIYRNVFHALGALHDYEEMERFYSAHKDAADYARAGDFALMMMARAAFDKGDYALSRSLLAKMRSGFRDSQFSGSSVILEARIAFAEKRYADAVQALDGIRDADLSESEQCEARLVRAKCLKEAGRVQEAEQEYARLIQDRCEGTVAVKSSFERADCLYRLGRYEDAARAMDALIRSGAAGGLQADAVLKFGEYLSYAGKLEEAIAQMKRFIESYPSSDRLADAYFRIGIDSMKKNDYGAMRDAFEQLLKRFPDDPEYAPKALYWTGWDSLRQEDYAKAKKLFARITAGFRASDVFYDALYWLGVSSHSLKENEQASACFKELLDAGKEELFSLTLLFWFSDELIKNGDFAHAAKAVAWLKKETASTQEAQRADYAEISLEGARKAYDRVLALGPAFSEKYPESPLVMEADLITADALSALGKSEDAVKIIDRLSQSENVDMAFRAFYKKAEVLEKGGQLEQAAREYLRLAILYDHPRSPEAAMRAYRIYRRTQSGEAAEKSRIEILERWPGSPEAKELQDE
jgi:TolA-binding protein